jgi:hypothetical protein
MRKKLSVGSGQPAFGLLLALDAKYQVTKNPAVVSEQL